MHLISQRKAETISNINAIQVKEKKKPKILKIHLKTLLPNNPRVVLDRGRIRKENPILTEKEELLSFCFTIKKKNYVWQEVNL